MARQLTSGGLPLGARLTAERGEHSRPAGSRHTDDSRKNCIWTEVSDTPMTVAEAVAGLITL